MFAVRASERCIRLPEYEPMGYLTTARLIGRAQSGDIGALQELWIRNARLCYSVANSIRIPTDLVADLIQESQEAFPRSINGFETQRLLEFSTYAYAALRRHMLRALWKVRFSTRVPGYLYGSLIHYLIHLTNAPTRSHWFDAREEMLDRGLYDKVRDLHAVASPEPLSAARLSTSPGPAPAQAAEDRDLSGALWLCLKNLDDRDRFILVHRYGLWHRPEMTLQQIGDILQVTRERVRQLQLLAEQRLRGLLGDPAQRVSPPSLTDESLLCVSNPIEDPDS